MKRIEFKSMPEMPVLDVDTEKKRVKVAFSNVGNVDFDNDVMMKGAFDKTWSERGPMGKNLIWHVVDHSASIKSVLGKPAELGYEGDYAFGITPMVDTALGNDTFKMYADGLINQHSFSYAVPKDRSQMKDGVRYIREVVQKEYSTVLWGANPITPTMEVIKSLGIEKVQEGLCLRLEKLGHSFKHGTYTDETFSLMEIEIKQIQQAITELSTYAATPVAPTPDDSRALFDVLHTLNNTLNSFSNGRSISAGG